ncbi:MAG: hypothetical protein QXX20_07710 [Candidatus Thermoplasmatota archaeon]
MNAIVYHEDFNKYDLGVDHPLIGDKPRQTMKFLTEKNILSSFDLLTPTPCSEQDLLRVHEKRYVDRVKELSENGGWLAADTPAPIGIYDIARLAAGGSILAGEKLFQGYNLSVNPLGGFHHASRAYSSGFCFFNDIAVTIEYLREKYHLKRCAILDLDVHHGNGTQDIYYDDPHILNISLHQDGRTLYPGTGGVEKIGRDRAEGYTINIPLPPATNGTSYLKAFHAIVPKIVRAFDPELIIYQSGVDTHHTDPLADLRLTYQTYYSLAQTIQKLSTETCNKLLVLFGGGYNSISCIIAYYNILSGILGDKDFYTEPETIDSSGVNIDIIIKDVKKHIKKYWKI